METRVNYTLVGLFVVGLGLALAGVIAWLTAATETTIYNLYRVLVNESVAGLNVNSPVNYKGMQVGQVMSIELDPENPDRVEVRLKVEQGVPIRQDTRARLVSRGLTGVVYVELSGGGQSPPLLPKAGQPPPVIKSEPSLVSQVENALNNLYVRLDSLLSPQNLTAISQTLTNIQDATGAIADRADSLSQTLRHLETVTAALADSKPLIEKAIHRAATTLDNSAKLSAELRGDIKPLLAQLQSTLAAVEKLTQTAARTSQQLGQAATAGRQELQQYGRTTAPELPVVLGELQRLTKTLERFIAALDRNPQMLLLGKPVNPPGPGE